MIDFTSMRILRIILIAIFLFLAVPLNGFCNDGHSQDVTHQCALVCHTSCCQSVLPNNLFSFNPPSKSTFRLASQSCFHENPFLTTSKRPPIVLS